VTKPWTVMFYIVAEPVPNTSVAEDPVALDAAADAELDAIADAARRFDRDLQVVCQVDFNGRRDVRRFVMDSTGRNEVPLSAPDAHSIPGKRNTLRRFLTWGSSTFRSERQAVFFWGHSFGPAGMFQTRDGSVVAPNTITLRQRIAMASRRGLIAEIPDPDRYLSIPDLDGALKAATGPATKHVDLVVFKDCFMNCLEVAYELGPTVDFQLGTQAVIPTYKKDLAPDASLVPSVWPYQRLLGALSHALDDREPVKTAGLAMLDALDDFYGIEDNRGNHHTIPCSLLDLRNIDDITNELDAFVTTVKSAFPRIDDRARKILAATCCDHVLMDVVNMCNQFSFPQASDLATAVRRHIVSRRPTDNDTFKGLSVYYSPEDVDDSVLAGALNTDDYQLLRLHRATQWKETFALEALDSHAHI
jgi:hypothetical protein